MIVSSVFFLAQLATEFEINSIDGLVKILVAIVFLIAIYFLKQFVETVRQMMVTVQLLTQQNELIKKDILLHEKAIEEIKVELKNLKK